MSLLPTHSARAERLRGLPALIAAQISLHSSMTGLRVVGPLMLLQAGAPTAQVGVLLACFGAGQVMPLLLAGTVAASLPGLLQLRRLGQWVPPISGVVLLASGGLTLLSVLP